MHEASRDLDKMCSLRCQRQATVIRDVRNVPWQIRQKSVISHRDLSTLICKLSNTANFFRK